MILKQLLIQYELQKNMSHVKEADIFNVSLSTYYHWLSGKSIKLKNDHSKLSDILKYDVKEVIEKHTD